MVVVVEVEAAVAVVAVVHLPAHWSAKWLLSLFVN